MSSKKQKELSSKDQNRKDQQKPLNRVVEITGTARGTSTSTAVAKTPLAGNVPSDAPPETAKAPAKAPKNAKRPTADTPTPAPGDAGETVVFAFRLTRSERDEIHAATGSAKASRFVKAIVLAGARGDMKAVQEIVDEIHAAKQ